MKPIIPFLITALVYIGIISDSNAQYCTPSAANPCTSNGGNETINRFELGSIDNSSGCSPVNYEDFFSNSGTVTTLTSPGSYPVSITVAHADFMSPYSVNVWIDLDSNQSFLDAGELVFHRNQATDCGSFGCNNVVKSGTLTIPAGVTPGVKRLRVRLCYKGESSNQNVPCGMIDYGEAEDYRIIIAGSSSPEVSTGTISGAPFCAGTSVSIPFTATGTFNSGNVFTAQLSDASGSFASPTTLGTFSGTASGTISGVIPAGATTGSNYRIRVVSSSPAATGTDNGVNMTINATVTPSITVSANPSGTICTGTSVTFTAVTTGEGRTPSYQWRKNGNAAGTNQSSYSDNTFTNGDNITCELTSNAPCASPVKVTSFAVVMNVNSSVTPVINITANPGTSICMGTTVTFTTVSSGGGATPSYQWKKNGSIVGGNTDSYTDNNLSDDDNIECTMTSSAGCASPGSVSSNTIKMKVGAAATAGTISAPRDTICDGTPGSLTVTGHSGSIQWQESVSGTGNFTSISGQTSSTYIALPTQTTYYRVYAGSGICVDSSNVIKLVVSPSPVGDFTTTSAGSNGKEITFNSNGSIGATDFDWTFGDGTTSSDPNPVHIYSADDTYHVCLTVRNGSNCSFTVCKDIAVITTGTGITDFPDENNCIVFPNPFSNQLFIQFNGGGYQMESVEVYDLPGRLLLNKNYEWENRNLLRIDMNHFGSGMYLLKIKSSTDIFVKPVIKQ